MIPSDPMPVCLQFGTERGAIGRARGELKTVRPGAVTRERFLEGEGKKAFWCRGGDNKRIFREMRRLPLRPDSGKLDNALWKVTVGRASPSL